MGSSLVGQYSSGCGERLAQETSWEALFFLSIREITNIVANEVTGTSDLLVLTSTLRPMALHPLRRMRCELFQVKRLQEHGISF